MLGKVPGLIIRDTDMERSGYKLLAGKQQPRRTKPSSGTGKERAEASPGRHYKAATEHCLAAAVLAQAPKVH